MKATTAIASLLLVLTGCQKTVDPACIEQPFKQGQVCAQIYQPVCGCNGKTYGNSCLAEGYGITQYTSGECGGK